LKARAGLALIALGAASLLPGVPALAQDGSSRPNYLPLSSTLQDVPIESVVVRVSASSGDAAQDSAAVAAVESLAAGLVGIGSGPVELAARIRRMEQDPAVARAVYRLLPSGANGVQVVFEVEPSAPAAAKTPKPVVFPALLENDRRLVTTIVAGGFGGYSDGNPWFGQPALFNASSPVAGNLPGSRTTWTEGSLELGAGFASAIGDRNLYFFGAVTGMFTWSLGQDIFRDDRRSYSDTEKAYAGLLYAGPATRTRAKLSIGRQTYTLNDGFLVNLVKGSGNVGPRGATYLGPRLANDFSVLADADIDDWGFSAFFIDPNELESLESDSRFLGANVKYAFSEQLSLDGTVLTVPNSNSTFATPQGRTVRREGSVTFAGHIKATNLFVDGLFAEGEVARQIDDGEDVSAWAGYGSLGYIARGARWSPSGSYRYALFSGDDPDTARFERFDAPLSTGLGIWLQGISFGKLFSNTNLVTHRVQLNVAPVKSLNITVDYHKLVADERNNLGANPVLAQLSSTDIGDELTLSGRWAINRNLYLQCVASAALPGRALKAVGADRTWSTLQLSLYWSL
jgi:hypothetical protein